MKSIFLLEVIFFLHAMDGPTSKFTKRAVDFIESILYSYWNLTYQRSPCWSPDRFLRVALRVNASFKLLKMRLMPARIVLGWEKVTGHVSAQLSSTFPPYQSFARNGDKAAGRFGDFGPSDIVPPFCVSPLPIPLGKPSGFGTESA